MRNGEKVECGVIVRHYQKCQVYNKMRHAKKEGKTVNKNCEWIQMYLGNKDFKTTIIKMFKELERIKELKKIQRQWIIKYSLTVKRQKWKNKEPHKNCRVKNYTTAD